MSSQPSITAEDAVQIAQRALQKVNDMESELDDLRQENQELRQRVEELEARQPENKAYDNLSRDEKVGLVRSHLVKKAHEQGGKAQIGYKGVLWEVFDGEPSDGHCYKLMKLAADESGFTDGANSDGEKRLKVDTAKIGREKTQELLSRVNNGEGE